MKKKLKCLLVSSRSTFRLGILLLEFREVSAITHHYRELALVSLVPVNHRKPVIHCNFQFILTSSLDFYRHSDCPL